MPSCLIQPHQTSAVNSPPVIHIIFWDSGFLGFFCCLKSCVKAGKRYQAEKNQKINTMVNVLNWERRRISGKIMALWDYGHWAVGSGQSLPSNIVQVTLTCAYTQKDDTNLLMSNQKSNASIVIVTIYSWCSTQWKETMFFQVLQKDTELHKTSHD